MVSDDSHRANLIHRYLPDYRIARMAHRPERIALAAESHADAILADESIGTLPSESEVPIVFCPCLANAGRRSL
jgi:hypothetical protein